MFYIGCHLSSSKGFLNMAKEATKLNANTFQFFTRNPRGGSAKNIDLEDIQLFNEFVKENNFGKIVAHAPYTLNPCSADSKIREFALQVMTNDLERMELIPNNYYNFHPGSHVKQGASIGIDMISKLLNDVLYKDLTTTVLLETMAGKGTEVGRSFEEIAFIIDKVNLSDKVGVCLDTCHISDAGYDIVNNLDNVLEEFDSIIGLDRLKAIHLNDSKNELGARKDRHEKIGEGFLKIDTFKAIINHPKLKNLPFLLETPNDLSGYANEIALLKSLYEE